MVGIVIVSHSASLARGAAELAREMAGPDVRIAMAGGIAGDDALLGTDAALVMAAIEAAFSADGVLVLMDLGSAVLSAETALEMLDAEVAAAVLLSDAPLVEGAVGAATAARLGLSLAEVAAEARRGLEGKRAHLDPPPEPSTPPALADPGEEIRIVVANPLGLHARPAARFVATAGRFEAAVEVVSLTTGRGPASGRSLSGLGSLGVRQGDEILVRAAGAQARQALTALRALADEDFGDRPSPALAPPTGDDPVDGATFSGLPAAPGMAFGPVRHLRREVPAVQTGPAGDPAEEWEQLQRALDLARADLRADRAAIAAVAGEEEAAIFDVQLLLLDDPALVEPAQRAILGRGVIAGEAWQGAVEAVAHSYRALDDPYLQARAADVVEVGNRVLRRLVACPPTTQLGGGGIVVTAEATAGDLAGLDPTQITGLATAGGGPLSHAVILARALGIPAVVGLGAGVLGLAEGTEVVVDGDAGALYVDPPAEVRSTLLARRAAGEGRRGAARGDAGQPAVTRDGRRIRVEANTGSTHEGPAIVAAGADGVGLLRTELLFLDRDTAPDEDEQYRAYLQLAAGLGGRPLVVRTLDAGADKPVPWLPAGHAEANPALGLRGLRLGLARPDVLRTQLRAVLRVAAQHPVRVMFPMVSTVEEVRQAKALLADAAAELAAAGRRAAHHVPVGVMVEVPAAALAVPSLAREVDFLSVGTNDLTQYVMAADRGNSLVAHLADGLEPAVLRLLARIVLDASASAARVPVAVCGAMAAEVLAVPVLVGLGVTALSVPPAAVAEVKQVVRDMDTADVAELAQRLLALDSAAAVRHALRGWASSP